MSERPRIETPDVVGAVETYVYDELASAAKYDNRSPLDESGIYSLHMLAAHVYALGYEAGERAAFLRSDRELQRVREQYQATNPTPAVSFESEDQ